MKFPLPSFLRAAVRRGVLALRLVPARTPAIRQVVVNVETTGFLVEDGNRILEIAAVELIDRIPTGREFHALVNPECDLEPGVEETTGLSGEILADKPRFADIADEFLAFLAESGLVMHHADFDIRFIDHELSLFTPSRRSIQDRHQIADTLTFAREVFPGHNNSLRVLFKRLGLPSRQCNALSDARAIGMAYPKLLALSSRQ